MILTTTTTTTTISRAMEIKGITGSKEGKMIPLYDMEMVHLLRSQETPGMRKLML